MQLIIATAATLALIHARSTFALSIDTPSSLVQCQPALLVWHDGAPPYYLNIIPGGQPGAPAMRSFDPVNDMSRTWVVDLPAGSVITGGLKDSTGSTAYTDKMTIQESQDTSCLKPPAASVPASAPSAPVTPAAPANGASVSPPSAPVSPPPVSPAASSAAAQVPSTPPASRPTGSQAAVASSSAKPSSGAIRTSVANGFAGLLAILGVVLF